MRTNIELDDELVQKLLVTTGIKTKRELIDQALRQMERREALLKVQSLRGIFKDGGWDEDYDYREARGQR